MPNPSTDTLSPLAKKTMRRLNNAFQSGQTGAMPEIIQTVRKLSGRIESVSVQDLSEIIERDPSVTEKVISAANTFGYNPSGAEITTISQAIHTVGFERIRNLTLSVMLAQNAGKGLNNEQQREMAALSVCSGMLAQNLVSSSDRFCADPDVAFVSGSLRNYGKLLMSTFFVEEYLEARELAKKGGDSAYCEVFGMTPLELGHALLRGTNLPSLIMESLQKVPLEKLARSAMDESEEILIAAEFCVKVCELTFNDALEPGAFQTELHSLVGRFGDSLPIDLEMVLSGLEQVDAAMSALNEVVGVRSDQSIANRALRARLEGRPVSRPKPAAADKQAAPMGMKEAKPGAEQSLAELLEFLEGESAGLSDEALSGLYQNLNQAISAELGLDSCMTFVPDEEGKKAIRYSARYGTGPLYERIKNRPLVASDKKDLFAICLNRREDILIQDTKAGKIASVIPEWIHEKGDVGSLIVLPAVAGSALFALFVGLKASQQPIEMEPVTHKRLKQFRARLSQLYAAL